MDMIDDEILQSFVEESLEHLADIENNLLVIEQSGADIDEDLVNKVFRAAHSIKGGAGFMGLSTIKELSHKIENVLGMIRSGEIVPNSEVVNICLLAFDRLRNLTENVAESNDQDISEHVVALSGITSAYLPEGIKEQVNRQVEICLASGQPIFTVSEFDISHARGENENLYLLEYDLIHDVHHENITPFELISRIQESASIIDCKVDLMAVGTLEEELSNRIPFIMLVTSLVSEQEAPAHFQLKPQRVHPMSGEFQTKPAGNTDNSIVDPPSGLIAESAVDSPAANAENPEQATETSQPHPKAEDEFAQGEPEAKPQKAKPAETKSGESKQTPPAPSAQNNLRVHVSLINKLMNLAGELVLGRNQLLQSMTEENPKSRDQAAQQISLVTSELQETIMMTRMQPIGNIFNKFQRLVRDLSRELGKKIDLEISGSDVELDKSMLEGLGDPLTHLMRNAADHGIEDVQSRIDAGKSETGTIYLRAFHQAGQINIEIQDDGKGIDPEKVIESAISKNLITPDQAEAMSDREKISMIFAPGFSTAEKVTDVSGRGVGMDVVKTNLEKLGGTLEIDSQPGKGTNMRIKLPLTLAIIPSLMISCCDQRYAVPLVSVVELVRVSSEKIHEKIEQVGKAQVIRLRDELLPLVRLDEILTCSPDENEDIALQGVNPDEMDSALNIVVLNSGTNKYGLVVDRLHESEEIVVKPLGSHLKKCSIYAGATILGNGCVSLILDVAGLAKFIRLNDLNELDQSIDEMIKADEVKHADRMAMTLFNAGPDQKFALPIEAVSRVEKISAQSIETVGEQMVIHYRDGILPIYQISQFCKARPVSLEGMILIVVVESRQRHFGLLATNPIDTVNTDIVLDDKTLRQPGILGSAIIQGGTTRILEIEELITLVESLNTQVPVQPNADSVSGPQPLQILYAEDSEFFRGQVRGILAGIGCEIIEAENGVEALEKLEQNADRVQMILTDIEMPEMDGYEFSRRVKEDSRFTQLPIIALTTLAGQTDIENGKQSGIDEYQIKLDKDQLVEAVQKYINANVSS